MKTPTLEYFTEGLDQIDSICLLCDRIQFRLYNNPQNTLLVRLAQMLNQRWA